MKFKNLFTLLVAFVLSFSIGTATLPAIAETATEQSYSSSEVLSLSHLYRDTKVDKVTLPPQSLRDSSPKGATF